jgi:hypothetical protein
MGNGSNPSRFKHDIAFKKIEAGENLSLDSLPGADKGFVMAIEVHGVDIAKNESLVNTVRLTRESEIVFI